MNLDMIDTALDLDAKGYRIYWAFPTEERRQCLIRELGDCGYLTEDDTLLPIVAGIEDGGKGVRFIVLSPMGPSYEHCDFLFVDGGPWPTGSEDELALMAAPVTYNASGIIYVYS